MIYDNNTSNFASKFKDHVLCSYIHLLGGLTKNIIFKLVAATAEDAILVCRKQTLT